MKQEGESPRIIEEELLSCEKLFYSKNYEKNPNDGPGVRPGSCPDG